MSRYFMYRGYLLPHLKFHLLVGRMLRSGFVCCFEIKLAYNMISEGKVKSFLKKVYLFYNFRVY